MIIILDNGHGINTKGKRSPIWEDGSQLFEWEFNRDVVRRISDKLNYLNIKNAIIVREENDISLSERVKRVNSICDRYKGEEKLFISIHANAGGGTGWEAYTTVGQNNSDKFAEILYNEAEKEFGKDWKIRKDLSDNDKDKEENFTVIYGTKCPSVLVENFFMDNEKDCRFIMSENGREACANVVVSAIEKWIKKIKYYEENV